MSARVQTACAWCGPAFVVLFFAGFIIAGLFPPPTPSESAREVAAAYRDNPDLRRLGLFLMLLAAGLTGPFVAVISTQLKRIEGGETMSNLQLVGGACGVVAIIVPIFIFMAATYRPGRSPEVTQALADLAWLPFIANIPPAIMQAVAIAVATLSDRSRRPVFPRWFGYYQLWVAFLFIPGGFVVFFKHGALAWNGLLAFWLAATVFGTWFIVTSIMLRRAISARAEA